MEKPLFLTLLKSRLGLRYAPHGHTLPNVGVEGGGQALSQSLGHHHLLSPTDRPHDLDLSFPVPEDIPGYSYLLTVLSLYDQAVQSLLQAWPESHQLLAIGGDHSVAYITLSAVLNRYGANNVGVLMIDSHADLHQPSTSPSGNFHGMWLRSLVDQFELASSPDRPNLSPQQVMFIGNLQTEPAELEFARRHQVPIYSSNDITPTTIQKILHWTHQFSHLHVSFDVDVFAESLAPATGTPNPDGFQLSDLEPVLQVVSQHPSLSLDVVEFNPSKPGAEQTQAVIENVLTHFLSPEIPAHP